MEPPRREAQDLTSIGMREWAQVTFSDFGTVLALARGQRREAGGNDQPTTKQWKASPRDELKDELARLSLIGGNAFSPPGKTKGNVDLTEFRSMVTGKTAYDRYHRLFSIA
ncbi:MAG: hypothetical protein QHC89_11580 [Bosea sp. (in: a-proteobacteria)]|nr:hypothetical protein [Bosea sp. (in: a-proteobacteria)]